MIDYEIAIVGGGIHGTILSHILTESGAVDRDRLIVIDEESRALRRWDRVTGSVGMRYLRSPGSHNLNRRLQSLTRFAESIGRSDSTEFTGLYLRPSLSLFNQHATSLIRDKSLGELRTEGRVDRVELDRRGATLFADNRRIHARRVVLAVGDEANTLLPQWAGGFSNVKHVYDRHFDPAPFLYCESAVVVGGGITAVQLAMRRSVAGKPTMILSPHSVRVSQFDSDPRYIGPGLLTEFCRNKDPEARGRIITEARFPGSIPPDLVPELDRLVVAELITYRVCEIVECRQSGQRLRLKYRYDDGAVEVEADSVVLATGFNPFPNPEGLVARLAREHQLRTDSHGRPILDAALRWHERLFVSGRAGELGVGPASPNIIGAHLAARRLVPFISRGRSKPADPWTPLR